MGQTAGFAAGLLLSDRLLDQEVQVVHSLLAKSNEEGLKQYFQLAAASGIMAMQITIQFAVPLVSNQPTSQARNYMLGTRVSQVIDDLNLPAGHIGMTLLNGSYADREQLLSDGDVLSLLPLVDGG